jgi:hypothetical protein
MKTDTCGGTIMIHSLAEPTLPSFDLHEQDGELILHADWNEEDDPLQIVLEDGGLIVRAVGSAVRCRRLQLPFVPRTLSTVSRPNHEGLEIHIPIPTEAAV